MLIFSRHGKPLIRKGLFLSSASLLKRAYAQTKSNSLPHFVVHPEVRSALQEHKPVVALESTIITHGMPHPENVKTALEVEKLVREHGACPASIGIIDGYIKVGLTEQELCHLAEIPRSQVIKCSRRDLPYVLATQQSGGTTVSATMLIAHRVGIKIFATGGIGGVHRDGHITMDVSADLIELGRTPVVVVCGGVKSILDIPRTLEYLETQGVCVATYDSPGGVFPDFYTRDSGVKVPYNLPSASHAADLIRAWQDTQLESGVLIGVPIPKEFAANKSVIDAAIDMANRKAKELGIVGKEITPFMLSAISKITGGNSLQTNIALIKNNATVAAQIAKKFYESSGNLGNSSNESNTPKRKPVVVGASILDLSFTVKDKAQDMKLNGATYTAVAKQAAGGVGRNIAEGIMKLYGDVHLISAIGKDQLGQSLIQMMAQPLQRSLIVDAKRSTSLCSLIFDKIGDCKLILGNMDIHRSITADLIAQREALFKDAPIIVMDSNISIDGMRGVLEQAKKHKLPVFFEPTDMFIAGKPFQLPRNLTQYIRILTPNIHELKAIVETITGQPVNWQPNKNKSKDELLCDVKTLIKPISSLFNCIIVTLGENGVLMSIRPDALQDSSKLLDVSTLEQSTQTTLGENVMSYYAAQHVKNIVNVSGAGDSFCSGFITSLLQGQTIDGCVAMGFLAAERALQSDSAVPTKYFADASSFKAKYQQTLESLKQLSI